MSEKLKKRTKEESAILKEKILDMNKNNKLSDIARKLNVSREYVRQVLKKHNRKNYNFINTLTSEQLEDIRNMLLSEEYSQGMIMRKYKLSCLQLLRIKHKLKIKKSVHSHVRVSKYDNIIEKFKKNELVDKTIQEIKKKYNLTDSMFSNILQTLKRRNIKYAYKKLKPGKQVMNPVRENQ